MHTAYDITCCHGNTGISRLEVLRRIALCKLNIHVSHVQLTKA